MCVFIGGEGSGGEGRRGHQLNESSRSVFLIMVFTLLLNRLHIVVFVILMFTLDRET